MNARKKTPKKLAKTVAGQSLGAATCSVVALPNDTKIRFCNALDALRRHIQESGCGHCPMYIEFGDGDLCAKGKDIIAMEMAYADTSIEFPPNSVLGQSIPSKDKP